jgi:hypothetical protein
MRRPGLGIGLIICLKRFNRLLSWEYRYPHSSSGSPSPFLSFPMFHPFESLLPCSVSLLSFRSNFQYMYSLITMLPCPIWYSSKIFSTIFLSSVFGWSVWNGACYYVDFFGKRFQKELEDLRAEVEKWQNSPLANTQSNSGTTTPNREIPGLDLSMSAKKEE